MISTFLPKKPKPKYFKIVPKLISMKTIIKQATYRLILKPIIWKIKGQRDICIRVRQEDNLSDKIMQTILIEKIRRNFPLRQYLILLVINGLTDAMNESFTKCVDSPHLKDNVVLLVGQSLARGNIKPYIALNSRHYI